MDELFKNEKNNSIEDVEIILTVTDIYTVILFSCGSEVEDIGFTISWDDYDEVVDEVMNNDAMAVVIYDNKPNEIEFKKNMMWLEPIKKYFNWKKGKKLYLRLKMNADGWFNVWENSTVNNYQYIVTEEGFCWGFKTYWESGSIFRKIYKLDCVYNNTIC